MTKTVLSIAGSDSCSGAGVQADIKTISSLGAYGVCAVTALTAQNSLGVDHIFETPADFVGKQIDSLANDFAISAVKTGMLVNSGIVKEVAKRIKHFGFNNVVIDPVIVSKNRKRLLSDEAVKAIVVLLFPNAFLVTPNIIEAEIITKRRIRNLGDMKAAARALLQLGPKNVLIKGGHCSVFHGSQKKAVDILYNGSSFKQFANEFLDTKGVRGTGCIFSAAITTELAKGNDVIIAISRAKKFISDAIKGSVHLGKGYALVNFVRI